MNRNNQIPIFTISIVLIVFLAIIYFGSRFNINQLIVDALTIITTTVGVFFIWLEFKRSKDLDEAAFIIQLNSEFNDSDAISSAYKVINRWSEDIHVQYLLEKNEAEKEELKYITEEENKKIVSYFTFFETINLLIKRQIIDFSVIDELFTVRFFSGANNPIIHDMKLVKYKYSYENIYELHEKWRDYRIKLGKPGRDKYTCLSNYYDICGKEYELRRLFVKDTEDIIELQKLVYNSLEEKCYFIESPIERFEEIFSTLDNLCLGIYDKKNKKLIGYANLVTSDFASDDYFRNEAILNYDKSQIMYFRTIFVHPEHRGRRIQREITRHFEKYCKYYGYKMIVLTVHPKNKYSKQNFIRSGFKAVDTINKSSNWIRNIMIKEVY